VTPSHAWARRRRPVGATELARTSLLSREEGSGTRVTAERALAARGEHLVPPRLELGSSAAIRSAVLAGAGPALLSDLVVAADITAGTLIAVGTTDVDLERALRVVWNSAKRPMGAAAKLVERALRAQGS
jgi:DNA-binding transcriptional LysR family regulator